MTEMISIGRARPRRRTGTARIPAVTESARLREQITRTAAGVRAYAGELRDEVERIMADIDEEQEDRDDH